jgi:hypothetical protein
MTNDNGLVQDYAIADTLQEIPEGAMYALHYYGETRYFTSELDAHDALDNLSWYEQSAAAILPTPRLRALRAAADLARVTPEILARRAANGDRVAAREMERRAQQRSEA